LCSTEAEADAEELGEPLPLGDPESGALEAASTAGAELAALLMAGAEVDAAAEDADESLGVGLTWAACFDAEHAASANATATMIAAGVGWVTPARRAARPRLGMPPC
jgi:hypothetical protein